MQPVCRSAPARPLTRPSHAGTRCQGGGFAWRRVAVAPALPLRARASCIGAGGSGGTTEPVPVIGEAQAEAVAEELELLEEAVIAGEDEGRRPTDYDRRAHIFEESSRVFRQLKQRRDGDVPRGGVQGGGDGTAAETTATRQPQQLG